MKFLCVFEMAQGVHPMDVTAAVVQSGFELVDEQQDAQSQTIIAQAPASHTKDDITEQLRNVEGCTLVRLAFSKADAEKKQKKTLRRLGRKNTILDITDEQSALAMIGKRYPTIAPAVKVYGNTMRDADRSSGLMDIGRKVGAGVYQRDYVLGSPLKLLPTISRELKPALKQFGDVTVDDFEIRLDDNPFCDRDSGQNCCDFVVGFIFGFLGSSPSVEFDAVEQVGCASESGGSCAFLILE